MFDEMTKRQKVSGQVFSDLSYCVAAHLNLHDGLRLARATLRLRALSSCLLYGQLCFDHGLRGALHE